MNEKANPYKEQILEGEQLFQSGDPAKAFESFNAVLREDPNNADALNNVGVVYTELNQIDSAISSFKKVLSNKPSSEAAFFNLLDILISNKSEDRAQQVFQEYRDSIQSSEEKNRYEKFFLENDISPNTYSDIPEEPFESVEDLLSKGQFLGAKKLYLTSYKNYSKYYDNLFQISSKKPTDIDFSYLIQRDLSVKDEIEKSIQLETFENPIFIGGCGSSGTTLFAKMIGNHPEIALGEELAVFDHPQIFQKSIEELKKAYLEQNFSTPDFLSGQVFPLSTPLGPYFGLFYPNHARHYHDTKTISALLNRSNSIPEFLNAFLTRYMRESGKHRWAEKTPNNIYTANQILKTYPNGKFIHVLRDGRDVIHSLVSRRNFALRSAIVRWLSAVTVRDSIIYRDRYLEIKYEDLVFHPEKVLQTVSEFLRVEYSDDMLKYHENNSDGFLGYATSPVFKSSVGKWDNIEWDKSKKSLVELCINSQLHNLEYI